MTIPFNYNLDALGGTEYMAKHFHKKILPNKQNFYNYQCLIFPGYILDFQNIINDSREIIMWLHNPFFQFDESILFNVLDSRFLKKIKYVIVPSNWHKKVIKKEIGIPENKIIVISNSFDPIEKDKNKFNKIKKVKIIYTSHPDRGLEILCKSLKYIKEDFELKIFSDIYPDLLEENSVIGQLEKDKRIMFFGKTPRNTVRKYFSESHIWAYPSIFLETFCISLAEAISAECLVIYPNIGALKETSSNIGTCYEYENNKELHAKLFAKILTDSIVKIKNKEFNPKNQAQIIEEKYNWKKFEEDWGKLHEEL